MTTAETAATTTTKHPTLRRLLLKGADPTTLPGYGGLMDFMADYPTMDEHMRSWHANRDRVGNPVIQTTAGEVGWDCAESYYAFLRYEAELATSSATRNLFIAKLPAAEREDLEARRRRIATPVYSMCIDQGGHGECSKCTEDIPFRDWYITIYEGDIDDPGEGWTICMTCAGRFLPEGMPLVQVR